MIFEIIVFNIIYYFFLKMLLIENFFVYNKNNEKIEIIMRYIEK